MPPSPIPESSEAKTRSISWWCFKESDLVTRLGALARQEITVDDVLMDAYRAATDPDNASWSDVAIMTISRKAA